MFISESYRSILSSKYLQERLKIYHASLIVLALVSCSCAFTGNRKLLKSGVYINSHLFRKTVFLEDKNLGLISDIVTKKTTFTLHTEIVIAGHRGALFTNENAELINFSRFKVWHFGGMRYYREVKIVDVNKDGIYEFLHRGNEPFAGPTLFSNSGNILWRYRKNANMWTAVGELYNDGKITFIISRRDGLHILDSNGSRIKTIKDRLVWRAEIVKIEDGQNVILHSNAGGKLVVRDKDGTILWLKEPFKFNNSPLEFYFSKFSVCNWPRTNSSQYAIQSSDEQIFLVDFLGKRVNKFDAPYADRATHTIATPIIFNNHPYFAVLVRIVSISILYIYDDNRIVYQEILPESCRAITALQTTKSGKEKLLVGCDGKVWQYEIKEN